MVTLRRDIAAMQDNGIFDRVDRDQSLITNYDKFMQEKKKSGNLSYFYSNDYFASQEDFSIEKKDLSKNKTATVDKRDGKEGGKRHISYDQYMKAQLNRKMPGEILTEVEFLNKNKKKAVIKNIKKEGSIQGLSKKAKIFIGSYLGAIIIVAGLLFVLI